MHRQIKPHLLQRYLHEIALKKKRKDVISL